jgi:Spy/CpxP family protein refolding chaperone
MKQWTRVGLAVGVAVIMGGLAAGVLTWAQEGEHFRTGGPAGEFRGGGFAAGGNVEGGPRMGARLLAALDNDRIKTELGLTEDQTNHLRQIVVDTQKSSIKTRADMEVRGIELRELLRADNPDRTAVMKKVDEISALRAEMLKQDMDALLNAKSVLTPEQQKKIRTFLERRRMGMGMEGRSFRGQGESPRGGSQFAPCRRMIAPPASAQPKAPEAPPQQP